MTFPVIDPTCSTALRVDSCARLQLLRANPGSAGQAACRTAIVVGMEPERRFTDHDSWPRSCVGHMEREPGRLQLRYVFFAGEGICDVEVDERDETVTVYGFMCAGYRELPVDRSESYEAPVHVYLDRPLAGRTVVDGHSGRQVPFRNVYAEIEAMRNESGPDERARIGCGR
jgi:hypothetical protein